MGVRELWFLLGRPWLGGFRCGTQSLNTLRPFRVKLRVNAAFTGLVQGFIDILHNHIGQTCMRTYVPMYVRRCIHTYMRTHSHRHTHTHLVPGSLARRLGISVHAPRPHLNRHRNGFMFLRVRRLNSANSHRDAFSSGSILVTVGSDYKPAYIP